MKKTIILLWGMLLHLNGVDLKSSKNNNSNKDGKYLYKISKKVSLEKDAKDEHLFTDIDIIVIV